VRGEKTVRPTLWVAVEWEIKQREENKEREKIDVMMECSRCGSKSCSVAGVEGNIPSHRDSRTRKKTGALPHYRNARQCNDARRPQGNTSNRQVTYCVQG